MLGIDRATLYNKLRKYQLRKDGEPEFEDERQSSLEADCGFCQHTACFLNTST